MDFFNENVWILTKISLKIVLEGPINKIQALVQIMPWCRPGDKPLSEPMMVTLLTHMYVSQWVNAIETLLHGISNGCIKSSTSLSHRLRWLFFTCSVNFIEISFGVIVYVVMGSLQLVYMPWERSCHEMRRIFIRSVYQSVGYNKLKFPWWRPSPVT